MSVEIKKVDVLKITNGALGPIQELPDDGLVIRPFTLFIGEQGTGKSLASQLVYFFRNLPFLAKYYNAKLGQGVASNKIIQHALDDIRSSDRAFATFASPKVSIHWEDGEVDGLSLELESVNRQINPHADLLHRVDHIRKSHNIIHPRGEAVFIPAERVLYSHARGPSTWQLLLLPSTLTFFADFLEQAAGTFKKWNKGRPDTNEGQWVQKRGKKALAGEVYRRGDNWEWRINESTQMDIDMASSGQKANWPLILLAEVLFTWRSEGLIGEPFYIHVEEPEIHLHPAAQVEIVKILAYLVNQGFKVVVTTHSLSVLYTINNLVLASALDTNFKNKDVPEPEIRLKPEQVAAYVFQGDGRIVDIVDRESGFISEVELGQVGEMLSTEMNTIERLRWTREEV